MEPNFENEIEALLSKMTLQEKVALLSGKDTWHTFPLERLGIPSLTMTDGPHGVRTCEPELGRIISPATCFPTGVSMAASWNPALVSEVGAALASETRAMGCDILLGPCVNIARTPLAGRNFESYSEDPFLAGKIAVSYIRGVQSQGVGTSLKHFACNNQETERMRSSSNLDERTLREIYLPAFEAAVKEAHPWTVMCSYNRINGVYASQNRHLLKEILKGEWGFDGFVVSDWAANHTIFESVAAGLDLEMPGPAKYYGALLEEAVKHWQIEKSAVDEAARRILRILARSGKLFGEAQEGRAAISGAAFSGAANTPEHQALARQLALEAITLLKNDGDVLPLDASKLRTLAVIGPNAAVAVIEGGGSSHVDPPYRISPLEALQTRLGESVRIEHEQGCTNFDGFGFFGGDEQEGIARAASLAAGADAVLLFAGMAEGYETEGMDRPAMGLPGKQDQLIQAVGRANPRTVVVLNVGSPVSMPWLEDVAGVLLAYFPGQENGRAVTEVLFGDANPSGKLPVTFPRRIEDTPANGNSVIEGARQVNYGEGIFVGYRWYDHRLIEPLFPFGHGLSYTRFEYSQLSLPESIPAGEAVQVSLKVRNTGERAGKEVVQIYVHDRGASLPRPPQELKAFTKVQLEPGEEITLIFLLDERAFAFYHPEQAAWVVEPGRFEIRAGSSSRAIHLRGELEITHS